MPINRLKASTSFSPFGHRVIQIIAKHTSNILVERALARDLEIAINAVRHCKGFLDDPCLISLARSYTKIYAKMMYRPDEFYIADSSLGDALVGYEEEDKLLVLRKERLENKTGGR